MWLFIQPNDTLFFRDGRPFDAGSDIWAGHIFPPYPPSGYGMLRSLLVHQVSQILDYSDFFKHVPEGFKALLGDKKRAGTLSARGPFLARRDGESIDLYIPCPADLYFTKVGDNEEMEREAYLLQPDPNRHRLNEFSDTSLPFLPLVFSKAILKSKEPEPEFCVIGGNLLMQYLIGHAPGSRLAEDKLESLWGEEPSTIIEREDNTITAKEEQLAHPAYIRMKSDSGLLMEIDNEYGLLFKDGHAARLGGECRVCFVEPRSVEKIVDEKEMIERIGAAGCFKALLTSPGYFPKNGYYPDFLQSSGNRPGLPEGEWEMGGKKKRVQLKTMACGRTVRIGGWDLAKGMPKRMIKAVPAGAVYYFEIMDYDEKQDMDWISALVAASYPGVMPGGDAEYVKQGFNTILIGGWDNVS